MDIDTTGKLNDWTFLHMKIYLDYFPGILKYGELGKSTGLTFWVPVQNIVEFIP